MKKNELQNEVRQLICNYLEQKKVSQNKLAEMLGFSPGTISNIVNEVWERINDKTLLKIKWQVNEVEVQMLDFTLLSLCS